MVFFPIQSGPPFWSQNPLGSGLGKFSVFSRFRFLFLPPPPPPPPPSGPPFCPGFPRRLHAPIPSPPRPPTPHRTRVFSSGSRQLANPRRTARCVYYTYISEEHPKLRIEERYCVLLACYLNECWEIVPYLSAAISASFSFIFILMRQRPIHDNRLRPSIEPQSNRCHRRVREGFGIRGC